MRVLLDENLPRDLADELKGHDVSTVQAVGWSGTSNGDLLRLAGGRFDALLSNHAVSHGNGLHGQFCETSISKHDRSTAHRERR